MASHALKQFLGILFAYRISGVCFFIDIRAAFYSVLRPLLYETGGDEESFGRLVLLLGLPASCIEPLVSTLREASAMQQAGASDHLQAVVHSLYNGLWWQVRGSEKVAQPQRGFCPGTGIADLAFSLVFRLFITSIQDRLRDLGLGIKLHCPDPVFSTLSMSHNAEYLDITWVDDTVIMTAVGAPSQIMPVARTIASVCFTELRKLGFTRNTKRGKSQLMPIVIGKGTADAVTDIYVGGNATFPVVDSFNNH
jgi:hypothetical protein